jgi:putative nucleotidyltransferase with HDIG domain
MNLERSHWRERLADLREAVDERDPRRFELLLMSCLVVVLTALIGSAYVPALSPEGTRSGWKVWVGIFCIMLLEAVVLSRLLHRFHKGTKEVTNNMLLAVVILMLGGTAVARLLIIPPLSAYVIPVAALGMVVSVILNARSALLLVTLASINVGLLADLDMRFTLAAFVVGSLSLYLVSKVTKRAALMTTSLISMFLAAFTIFALELCTEASVGDALRRSLWGFGNGFLTGFLTVLLLLFLESVLNVTTPLRLLELADPSHPLLKKLLQIAPGTYNHSIMMGTLAEAAAEAIGANPNLARVGAYYHDIGKLARPEYFIENQIYVGNPHDHLSPHLSKVAITAHIRDGERLGRMYGLPKPLVDIVKQHHGTSVLSYFYNKAKETSKEAVDPESYRYESERPQSKEAAIIMLADGIEAAVRALEGHLTRRKIQGVIQEIIKQRTDDGQLDESTVTQGDLHRIAEAFDTSLVGLLGRRIAYTESVPSLTPGAKRAPASDAGIRPKANDGQRPKPRAGRPVGGRE